MEIITFFNTENAVARVEHSNGESFLHCDVFHLSPSLIKDLKNAVQALIKERKAEGVERPLFSYTQNPHFCKITGGNYLTNFSIDDKTYEVWMWE